MNIDKNVNIARKRFSAWLIEEKFEDGAKLPSERNLCQILDIRRMTLRQVLLSLELENCIFRKNRVGWFITPKKFIYDTKCLSSFSKEASEQGRTSSWEYLTKEIVQSLPSEFSDVDTVCKVTGWCGLDGHKVFYHESFLNADIATDLQNKLKRQSFSDLWEMEYGYKLAITKLVFRPINMPLEASRQLGVTPNAAGILIERHRSTDSKQVVQIDYEYWRFESVELVINNL